MMYIMQFSLLLTLIFFFSRVYAEDTIIQILIEKPDLINGANWKSYSTFMDQYTLKVNPKNSMDISSNVHVHFSFNPDEKPVYNNNNEYVWNVGYLMKQLQDSKYDMMVVDEKFLYSDVSVIKSDYVISSFNLSDYYNRHDDFSDFYVDLTDYIKKEELSHHDDNILSKSYLNDRLYALPFGIDFNLLYYYNNENSTKLDFEFNTWDDLVAMNLGNKDKDPLSVAFAEKDELLDLFVEYLESQNDQFYNNGQNYFDLLYSEESKKYYNSFKDFINKSSLKSINRTLETTFEDAYNSFITNKQSVIFNGKASQFNSFVQNNVTVTATLPPKHLDVINGRFLIINKNSKVKKEILIDVAQQLTSKEMELIRAERLGSIPTFNIQMNDKNYVKSYCQYNSEICSLLKKMKPINIKEIFKSSDSAPFMEVRFYLPENIKEFLIGEKNLKEFGSIISNIKYLIMDKPENKYYLIFGFYILTLVFSSLTVYIMYLIYKYRNNSNIKYLSPGFCNIIMLGFIMCMISPVINNNCKSAFQAKILFIYDMINTVSFFLPMFLITFRIYLIYSNKTKITFGNKLDNKHLYLFFSLVLASTVIYSIINTFVYRYYVISFSNIDNHRRAIYDYSNHKIVSWVCMIIYLTLCNLYGYKNRKCLKTIWGIQICVYYDFCISCTVFIKFYYKLLPLAPRETIVFANIYYIVTFIINSYALLGSRLIYVMKHPEEDEFSDRSPFTNDTTLFLPTTRKLNKQNKYKFNFQNSLIQSYNY
ncbi:periplasmic binding protein-like II [Neocallimastix californiae]|uniref:Periplasmic binding protein-like II n=1 Tax=Neocallimastix californiae TaxID=1754190 RepID=A0A1Y2D2B7_9FUNG|nr:periplasmic binding protein-like II [Neocallimastix californiae]|eukprot:ORY53347.1 periplasmic binding protein-like II [Neocallimastix californiae]